MIDPSRKLRWQGDDKKFKYPHFIADSPTSIEHKTVTINGKKHNKYNLVYKKALKPYDVCKKVATLTFITLQANKSIKPGKYQLTIKPFDPTSRWQGKTVKQDLEILPALKGKASSRYNWGVDAIYTAFLSEKEQDLLLKSFADAGITYGLHGFAKLIPRLQYATSSTGSGSIKSRYESRQLERMVLARQPVY